MFRARFAQFACWATRMHALCFCCFHLPACPEDLTEQAEAAPIIERLTAELEKRLTPYASRRIKNQQVKLKFSDFTQTTVERQSDSLDSALTQTLLESAWDRGFGKGVRLIGLGVHFYDPEPEQSQQLALFEAAELQGAP